MKPELVEDGVLQFLERMTALGEKGDPLMAELDQLPEWWRDRDQTLTMKVVAEVVDFSGWADWLLSVRERVAEMG